MKTLFALMLFVCGFACAADGDPYNQDDGMSSVGADDTILIGAYPDSESFIVAAAVQAMLSTDYPASERLDDPDAMAAATLANTVMSAVNDSAKDPSSIVSGFYNDNTTIWPADAEDRSPVLSEYLSAQVEVSQRKFGQFFLMFDPIVNGQDALIRDLIVRPAVINGNRAYVNVRFRNFDTANVLIYSFVREKDGWKLDELASIGGETRWLLSDVLRNP